MAYQALYRKYRPSTFDDFIDQDSIKKILVNSIRNDKISHAYLFSGPRGIGKTSMAKIFAKAINCDNFDKKGDACNKCNNCLESNEGSVDIIEIDAASNNGVDQIRDLKNKISIVPSSLKYKVYIIDEVHMLTNSAFNALLKTLEEPPSYVVFILATTEFYEVPETIVSRCQCFNFNRISMKSMEERLKYIAKKEKITISNDAITEIAYYANGGLRDAIGMLDKLRSFTNGEITVDIFKSINGMISQEEINKFYNGIFENNVIDILNIIDCISEQGYDFKNFIERVMLLVRDKIVEYYTNKTKIVSNIENNVKLVSILNDILNALKEATNPMVMVQVFVLKFMESINVGNNENISREINLSAQNDSEKELNKEETTKDKQKPIEIPNVKDKIVVNEKVKKIRINNAMATANIKLKKELNDIWKQIDKYFMDNQFGKVAQLLSDTIPMVVGPDYVILTTSSLGIIDNLYCNLNDVENFISQIYHKMLVILISNNEFEDIKKKYIEDKKNGIVYQLQDEKGKLIEEKNSLINQAISVFGTDLVDIE